MRYLFFAAALFAIAGAVAAQTPAQVDARKRADQLTGNAPGKAAGNPVCRLFSQAEISKHLGVAIGPAEHKDAPDGIACSWSTKDFESWVAISSYNRVLPGAPKGSKALAGVGDKGYVVHQTDTWEVGANDGAQGIVVQLYGSTGTEAAATLILQEAIKRRKR